MKKSVTDPVLQLNRNTPGKHLVDEALDRRLSLPQTLSETSVTQKDKFEKARKKRTSGKNMDLDSEDGGHRLQGCKIVPGYPVPRIGGRGWVVFAVRSYTQSVKLFSSPLSL
jgi:hypothetical protein